MHFFLFPHFYNKTHDSVYAVKNALLFASYKIDLWNFYRIFDRGRDWPLEKSDLERRKILESAGMYIGSRLVN